jgi:RNA polymerase sigma-70 factor (ECF subfamily)
MTGDRLRQAAKALNQGVSQRVEGGQAAAFQATLNAAARGDEDAFGALWRNLQPTLLNYLKVIAPDSAEDLSAETWLEVIRKLDRFQGDEPAFRSWVLTIARQQVVDWRRRSARRRTEPLSTGTPERAAPDWLSASVADTISGREALSLVTSLPPAQAEVVILRVIAGLNVAEVAAITGKTPSAVRMLSHRALRRLAQEVKATQSDG